MMVRSGPGDKMNLLRRFAARRISGVLQRRPEAFRSAGLAAGAMVFAPHSDDETLGCGGTIARMTAAGASVRITFLTDGAQSHPAIPRDELAATRRREALAAAAVLGVPETNLAFLDFPDGGLSAQQDAAKKQVVELLTVHRPRQVFVPFREDGHPDHRACYWIVRRAVKDARVSTDLLEYPVWAWRHWPWVGLQAARREFGPWRASARLVLGLRFAWIFRSTSHISPRVDVKRAALAEYQSQLVSPVEGDWSLAALNNGEFLECFQQPYEVFRRTRLRP
jgi:LmbE family N-acetylglucosaminyl deacetylase